MTALPEPSPPRSRWQGRHHAAMPQPRRFPPPWAVEETDACFIVRDAHGRPNDSSDENSRWLWPVCSSAELECGHIVNLGVGLSAEADGVQRVWTP